MTENKRFTITGDRSISDHQKKRLYDLNDFDGMISVTECLNELHEENIILNSELSFSKNQNRKLRKILEDNRSMLEVVQENELLKKEIERLK